MASFCCDSAWFLLQWVRVHSFVHMGSLRGGRWHGDRADRGQTGEQGENLPAR